MRLLSLMFILTLYSNGGIYDGYNRYMANSSMTSNDLNDSKDHLESIDTKDDMVSYNLAHIAYRQKNYKDAIEYYSKINSKELQYKKLHNLGNSYVKLNELEKAMKAYEDALTYEDNEDTRFNLELLKKNKEKQEQQKQEKDNKKQDKKEQDKKEQDKKDQDKKEQEKNDKDNNKQQNKKSSNEDKENDKSKDEQTSREIEELTTLEEKKWDKMLNQRDLGTLMIPMDNKGEPYETITKPW